MMLRVDKKTDVLDVLSEVAFDAEYFNEVAFANYIESLKNNKYVTGILIDGAATRLDRPEVLNELLSYWNKSAEECDQASEAIPYYQQYQHMLEVQMEIIRKNVLQIKQAAPQAVVALCIPTDDTHFTLTALINELLRYRKSDVTDSIQGVKEQIQVLVQKIKDAQAELRNLKGKQLKNGRRLRENYKKIIKRAEATKLQLKAQIKERNRILSMFRRKKVRPAHQQRTHEFIGVFLRAYTTLCKDLGIRLVTKPSILKFGNLVVDYAHSRHRTWTVIKSRDRQLVLSKHGKMTRGNLYKLSDFITNSNGEIKVEELTLEDMAHRPDVKASIVEQAKKDRIDVILETGHHGIGFKQTQKITDIPEEINFTNQASYAPIVAEEHITFVMAPPFEDQEKIGAYKVGRKPARMKLGIPLNTTTSEVFRRLDNNSVSGLCTIQKNDFGVIQTEWIQYQNFKDGSVLNQPKEYAVIAVSSDEHKGSAQENHAAQRGFLDMVRQYSATPFTFRGRPARIACYINAGDVGEANSSKWPDRYDHKPDPERVLTDIFEELSEFNKKNIRKAVQTSMQFMSYALAGTVENMDDILDRVASYYMDYLNSIIKQSKSKWVFLCVPGNHVDDVFRSKGVQEYSYFKQRLIALGIKYFEVGVDRHLSWENNEKDARVGMGGFSNARILNIRDFGIGLDGNPLFGPINLLVQHDPKGPVSDAGKSADTDLTIIGHRHHNVQKLYKTGDNTFGVAYEAATLQGVTSTEKMYAGGIPRTQAAHLLIMPMPGDFSEITLPAHLLGKAGVASIEAQAEAVFNKKLSEKKE